MPFELREMDDQKTGTKTQSIVELDDSGAVVDVWCSIQDLDTLFNTCVDRWNKNWDLSKVCLAISECEFD